MPIMWGMDNLSRLFKGTQLSDGSISSYLALPESMLKLIMRSTIENIILNEKLIFSQKFLLPDVVDSIVTWDHLKYTLRELTIPNLALSDLYKL